MVSGNPLSGCRVVEQDVRAASDGKSFSAAGAPALACDECTMAGARTSRKPAIIASLRQTAISPALMAMTTSLFRSTVFRNPRFRRSRGHGHDTVPGHAIYACLGTGLQRRGEAPSPGDRQALSKPATSSQRTLIFRLIAPVSESDALYPVPGSSGIWAPCQTATTHTASSLTR